MDIYEKKYKEALARARQFSEHPLQEDSDSIVEYIFPELKESEDGDNKRISKEITQFLKQNNGWNREWLAWLEKQGEQKPAWSERDETILNSILSCIKKCQDEDTVEWYLGDFLIDLKRYEPMFDWLNSLKKRIEE